MNEFTSPLPQSPATSAMTDGSPAGHPGNVVASQGSSPISEVSVKVPEFAPLQDAKVGNAQSPISRFYDVNVTVSAELGRVSLPIGELMQLGEGSVLELNRPVSAPVDLVAQGVRIARGEVVVVDDCFAIRIRELEPPDHKGS